MFGFAWLVGCAMVCVLSSTRGTEGEEGRVDYDFRYEFFITLLTPSGHFSLRLRSPSVCVYGGGGFIVNLVVVVVVVRVVV
jgi:hypothetical protein